MWIILRLEKAFILKYTDENNKGAAMVSKLSVRSKVLVTVLILSPLLLIGATLLWFQYEDRQLKNELNHLQVPESWEKIEEKRTGSRLCFTVCPSYSYEFSVDAVPTNLIDQFENIVVGAGYSITNKRTDCSDSTVRSGSICSVLGEKNNMTLSANLVNRGVGSKTILLSVSHRTYFFGIFRE